MMVEEESPSNEWIIEDCPEDLDWKTQLINGNFFMKHHKWTKPKLRLIWSSERLDEIFWADPKESRDTNKIKGRIKVKDMKEVKTGLHKSKITEVNRMMCTFTILTKNRTLELEAPTVDAQLKWIGIFKLLMGRTK